MFQYLQNIILVLQPNVIITKIKIVGVPINLNKCLSTLHFYNILAYEVFDYVMKTTIMAALFKFYWKKSLILACINSSLKLL